MRDETAQGRARSARNAHRHGLSLPVLVDPVLSQEVEALAREVAGANASSEIQELARRIAEAQIDLRRVRCRPTSQNAWFDWRRRPSYSSLLPFAARILDYARSRPERPQKFATILSDMAQRLAVMDRYERRGLSMRHEGKPPARSNGGAGYIDSQIGIERMIVKAGPTAALGLQWIHYTMISCTQ
jgi:hypothetical protein